VPVEVEAGEEVVVVKPPIVNFTNILRAAFSVIFFQQKLQTQVVSTEKLCKILLYKKATRKMLVKVTPVVDFVVVEAAVEAIARLRVLVGTLVS